MNRKSEHVSADLRRRVGAGERRRSTRRTFLLAGIAWLTLTMPHIACGQQQPKVWRIGILHSNTRATASYVTDAFTQGLRQLGYTDGKNIVIEYRFAEGNQDRLPALAADLVQQKVDVIFASNGASVQAAKRVAGTIPIVFASVGDPVGSGFAATLARPGGNITGTTIISSDLSAKRLQLLKEAFPRISRVAVFTSTESPGNDPQVAEVHRASKALGMEILSTQLGRREEFKQELALLRKWRADSIYVTESPTNSFNRKLLAEFAADARLPAVFGEKGYAEAGGLMSYGANYAVLYRRAATYVDKILKGAKPGDLPIEQPTKFELVINMKTAKALGVTIPQSVMLQTDRVIE
jgi:putative ABC transport system substrate-binding protein